MKSWEKRAQMLMWCSAQLDYWVHRKDRCREGEEQYEYYTNMMKFIVTRMDTDPMRDRPNGPNIVFPCL